MTNASVDLPDIDRPFAEETLCEYLLRTGKPGVAEAPITAVRKKPRRRKLTHTNPDFPSLFAEFGTIGPATTAVGRVTPTGLAKGTCNVPAESQQVDPAPVIPSDAFVVGDIDFANPVEVKDALARTTFGNLFSDEAVETACRRGTARDLFPNSPMDEDHPHVQSMRNWVEPSVDNLWAELDLETRALMITSSQVYGTDEDRRALILSVKDAGIFGALAQANLPEPEPTRRRPWPWWYRPWRRNRSSSIWPNLFARFETDETTAEANSDESAIGIEAAFVPLNVTKTNQTPNNVGDSK